MKFMLGSYRDVQHHAIGFDAKFMLTGCVDECADNINKPHKDDYPTRVNKTRELILSVTEVFKDTGAILVPSFVRSIHGQLYREDDDTQKLVVNAGGWRNHSVGFDHSDTIPPDHYMVPEMMDLNTKEFKELCLSIWNIDDLYLLQDWYRIFETVHPFNDGNGRVGGIITAAASYHLTGTYLTALQ